jgi:uncharacterized membrane protein
MACRGNEPFWQLQIDGATAIYQRLGDAAIELAGSATPLDYLPRPELVWRGRAATLGGDLVAWITEESCLDTMSDREGSSAFSPRIRISLPGGESWSAAAGAASTLRRTRRSISAICRLPTFGPSPRPTGRACCRTLRRRSRPAWGPLRARPRA